MGLVKNFKFREFYTTLLKIVEGEGGGGGKVPLPPLYALFSERSKLPWRKKEDETVDGEDRKQFANRFVRADFLHVYVSSDVFLYK